MSSDCCVVNLTPAYSDIGPLIFASAVSSFAPPNNCRHDAPVSAGPAPPSRFAPWQEEQECWKRLPPTSCFARRCTTCASLRSRFVHVADVPMARQAVNLACLDHFIVNHLLHVIARATKGIEAMTPQTGNVIVRRESPSKSALSAGLRFSHSSSVEIVLRASL